MKKHFRNDKLLQIPMRYSIVNKGQLISKGNFVCFSILPKKRTKNFCTNRLGQNFEFFTFVFWENWRDEKDVLKLNDL